MLPVNRVLWLQRQQRAVVGRRTLAIAPITSLREWSRNNARGIANVAMSALFFIMSSQVIRAKQDKNAVEEELKRTQDSLKDLRERTMSPTLLRPLAETLAVDADKLKSALAEHCGYDDAPKFDKAKHAPTIV